MRLFLDTASRCDYCIARRRVIAYFTVPFLQFNRSPVAQPHHRTFHQPFPSRAYYSAPIAPK